MHAGRQPGQGMDPEMRSGDGITCTDASVLWDVAWQHVCAHACPCLRHSLLRMLESATLLDRMHVHVCGREHNKLVVDLLGCGLIACTCSMLGGAEEGGCKEGV